MIRYCESIALIDAPERTHAQYRVYAAEDVHTLRFVKRAAGSASRSTRRALLALWRDKSRAGADVKRFAEAHIGDLETRIAELQAMPAPTARS